MSHALSTRVTTYLQRAAVVTTRSGPAKAATSRTHITTVLRGLHSATIPCVLAATMLLQLVALVLPSRSRKAIWRARGLNVRHSFSGPEMRYESGFY